ncbi:MAG TPA: tRNA (guanosine(37)-N1)-methyltransferase TrmD [Firmicutes bacterium]|jgi:tRNA (guanine37-N1)-methyltransferase|nr:tRNA (guanosine(37)-N1)-methyltransferase TrmD [Bacillota bacterium]
MLIDIVSIFPAMFRGVFGESIIRRAEENGLVRLRVIDLRDFSSGKHRKVDDAPFGGGAGMVMKPEPFFKAVSFLRQGDKNPDLCRVVLMSPRGKLFTQERADQLSKAEHLIVLCGHYEGVDERVHQYLAQEVVSIGNYVLTGGELPAMVLVDAVTRLIPGVLSDVSLEEESFSDGLLEYPQYTRPRSYLGMTVPEVLLSGNHELIKRWRQKESWQRTLKNRPEILKKGPYEEN